MWLLISRKTYIDWGVYEIIIIRIKGIKGEIKIKNIINGKRKNRSILIEVLKIKFFRKWKWIIWKSVK